ncbi:MAG: MlaE family ABC transporter permease [Armatimonadota bacterium]
MMGPLRAVGHGFLAALTFVGQTVRLLAEAGWYIVRGQLGIGLTVYQMSEAGVRSLVLATLTVFVTGLVFCYYLVQQSARWALQGYVGYAVAEAIFRELGPVLAAGSVAARAGSAMTAELGSMVITEQVDALRALGVDPVRYLVSPRLAAMTLMMPVAGLMADMAGITGGYLMAAFGGGLEPEVYIVSIRDNVPFWSLAGGLIKTLFFGLTIAIVACHYGLRCERGAQGVGRATMRCVVMSIVLIYLSNYFLTTLLY